SSRGSHGFFFYAGHGKQSGGANYLIPVQAKDFSDEIVLRNNAMSLNTVMQRLDRAGNELNLIVLDACRDNPFTRERSGARGLSTVTHSPVGSMIMYATGPDSWADDGDGRNGLFTGHLIKNLKTPRISLQDVLTRTGLGVINETDKKNKKQVPQLYDQFFKAGSIFWNGVPSGPGPVPPPKSDPAPKPKPEPKPTPAPVPVPEVPEPLPPARSVCPRSGIEYQVGVSNDNREVIIRFYRPEGIKFPSNGVWTMEWSLEGSANVQNPKGSTKINKNDSVTHIYEAKLKVINPNAMVQLGTIKVVALSFTID
ncbi:MAG: caspase family protein, partial [Holophagaceae bacterium]|nr:caspase family protein [Holophagaceae bacterium]